MHIILSTSGGDYSTLLYWLLSYLESHLAMTIYTTILNYDVQQQGNEYQSFCFVQ